MKPSLNLYSEKENEIKKFLEQYYSKNFELNNNLFYNMDFDNPIDMIEIVSCLIDNDDKYSISPWINLDDDIFILITCNNLNSIIKYLFERYPY